MFVSCVAGWGGLLFLVGQSRVVNSVACVLQQSQIFHLAAAAVNGQPASQPAAALPFDCMMEHIKAGFLQ